jgi:hypothetical protein
MGNNGAPPRPAPDLVDAAIAAAEAPKPVTMTVAQGAFNDTGRPFHIEVPADLSDGELGAMVELLVRIKNQGAAAAAPRPRLFVPG